MHRRTVRAIPEDKPVDRAPEKPSDKTTPDKSERIIGPPEPVMVTRRPGDIEIAYVSSGRGGE